MELPNIARIVAWIGGTLFTYVYIVGVGNLRDDGKTWFEALFKNQTLLFGFMGIITLLSLIAY
jgi:hypothetical protein